MVVQEFFGLCLNITQYRWWKGISQNELVILLTFYCKAIYEYSVGDEKKCETFDNRKENILVSNLGLLSFRP